MAARYAVIGNPVAHSKSPRIHALFAQQTGQDVRYEALMAPLDGFAATVRAFMAEGGRGANVTLPFKEEAHRLASRLSSRAQAAGAANTLVFDAGEIFGDNTDGEGLVRDLSQRQGCAINGKRLLLLGAGGAARGVLVPLLEEQPASLVIANRTPERAIDLAARVGEPYLRHAGDLTTLAACSLADLCRQEGFGYRGFDIVINATAAALQDGELALPPGLFAPGALAYDMLYGRQTSFMRHARAQGARVADGLGMLVEQAAASFFLWRGVRPQTAPVLAQLRLELGS